MKIFVIVALWIASLAACFYAGSRIGARENWLALSEYRAAISAGRLRMMEKNRTKELQDVLEIQLDDDLVQYSAYLDSNWKWLWPGLQGDEHPIRSAAKYRASHPFSEPDLGDPKNRSPNVTADDPFIAELVKDQKDNRTRLERVVHLYAGP